ncbi:hypothetical protein [Lacicoccus qingdaonensis]|uniref:Uncharacterized protein n=1 Tax=Lacicoccus qingdaonensis TaxID=576118 RepID=A0A1G9FXP8_9BACL|nr:hypothetical protein [Salinicoccus qingdaonensis]SDK93231.1 hypothetical protein SAMN05216216_11457 [Salinicoccus qingdaonensis]
MELKKYLLAGGLASVMVLGACGGGESEEDPAAEDPAMEEGAEDPAMDDEEEEDEEEDPAMDDEEEDEEEEDEGM